MESAGQATQSCCRKDPKLVGYIFQNRIGCDGLAEGVQRMNQTVEIRASYRYVKEHSWVVQGITGFLSAYFMEKPGFNLNRHFDELETGVHVWVCDIPPKMKVPTLLRRLKEDIPPCHYTQLETSPPARPQFLIDSQETESTVT
jgi:hypothetical protein